MRHQSASKGVIVAQVVEKMLRRRGDGCKVLVGECSTPCLEVHKNGDRFFAAGGSVRGKVVGKKKPQCMH